MVQHSNVLKHPGLLDDKNITDAAIRVEPLKDSKNVDCSEFSNLGIVGGAAALDPAVNFSATGVKITARVAYQTSDGNKASCFAESSFAYDGDNKDPGLTIGRPQGNRAGVWSDAIDPVTTICDTGMVRVPLVSDEAGSIFLCSRVSGGAYESCEGFELNPILSPGSRGNLHLTGGTTNVPTQAAIEFLGLNEGQYTFYVKTLDTAGRLSTEQIVFFTIDLTSPSWTGPIVSVVDAPATQKVVDLAQNLPEGTLYTDADPRRNQFGTNNYQCNADLEPLFEGTLSTTFGNELCDGVTTGVPAANSGRTVVALAPVGGKCRFRVEGVPSGKSAFAPGEIQISVNAKDVCSPPRPLPPASTRTFDWVIDPNGGSSINASHSIIAGFIPGIPPIPIGPVMFNAGPSWNLNYTRSEPALNNYPIVWDIQKATGAGAPSLKPQNSSAVGPTHVSQAEQNWASFNNNSCIFSRGFCSKAYGPCGQWTGSSDGGSISPTFHYAVRGVRGKSCWQVGCQAGLTCHNGICRDPVLDGCGGKWKCTNHSDCMGALGCSAGWGTNFNAGTCASTAMGRYCQEDGECVREDGTYGYCADRGGGVKTCECSSGYPIGYYPGVQNNQDPDCPDSYAPDCGGVDVTCTCDIDIANATCPSYHFINSCNILNACRGRNPDACLIDQEMPISITCPAPLSTNWLGARVDQTVMEAVGVGDWAIGGVRFTRAGYKYNYECSTTSAGGPWSDCRYGSWPESPTKPNANPLLNFWIKVTDARDDYEIQNCQYKLDRTKPTFPTTPIVPVVECGISAGVPTVSNLIRIGYQADDTHSATQINLRNTVTGATASCTNPDWNNTNCTETQVGVEGQSGVNSPQSIEVIAIDAAGNSQTANVDAFVAVRTGLDHSFNPGTSSFTQQGCSNPPCTQIPWTSAITNTITGGNQYNYTNLMALRRVIRNASGVIIMSDSLFANTFPNGVNNSYKLNDDEARNITYRFRDRCGNESQPFSATLQLDWKSPSLAVSCAANDKAQVDATEFGSGLDLLWGSCTNGTETNSVSTRNNTLRIDLLSGTNTCTFNAIDNITNTTESRDGYNQIRKETLTCEVAECTGEYFPDLASCQSVLNSTPNCEAPSSCIQEGSCYKMNCSTPPVCPTGTFQNALACEPQCLPDTCTPVTGGGGCWRCSGEPVLCDSDNGLYADQATCKSATGCTSDCTQFDSCFKCTAPPSRCPYTTEADCTEGSTYICNYNSALSRWCRECTIVEDNQRQTECALRCSGVSMTCVRREAACVYFCKCGAGGGAPCAQ